MLWPSRREHGPAGPGRPAAPDARVDEVHASPGIEALFAGLEPDGSRRILDLGPAVGATLAVYSPYAATVRFVDLLAGSLDAGGERLRTPALEDGAIGAALPEVGEPYDLMLLWDLLDYLDRDEAARLIARLDGLSRPGTRLYAAVGVGRTTPALPRRFELVDTATVRSRTVSAVEGGGPALAPAEVERRLAPFRVTRSVILRHGVREYVAVRRGDEEETLHLTGQGEPRVAGRVLGGVRSRRMAEAVVAAAVKERSRSSGPPR